MVRDVKLRSDTLMEKWRSSLFLLPMLCVVGAIALGQAMLFVDQRLDARNTRLPFELTATVESARAVLGTIAAATIGFAGVAFSVSLLIIQLGSSQYSPRVVHTLFRDPFNKRVMGVVIGTFAYCLVVLRSVHSPIEQSGDAIVPSLSVAIAVGFGIVAILAIVAFIDHSAHSMDISEILERVSDEAIVQTDATWHRHRTGPDAVARGSEASESAATALAGVDLSDSFTVRFERHGWVQQIGYHDLIECAEPGATIVLHTIAGRYAFADTPLCTITPRPTDVSAATRRIRATIGTGGTRTMQQDPSYGLRQLADVSLKALSPGINDPTTAQDAIFHASAVLSELLHRSPPPAVMVRGDGRRLIVTQQLTHRELVDLTFDEVRRAAAPHPTVCVYLLEAIETLHESLHVAGLTDRLQPLEHQAALVVEGCEATDQTLHDMQIVRDAYNKRFRSDADNP